MGPVAAVALKNPEAIKNMIRDNGDGTYTVTFKEKIPTFLPPGAVFVDKKITVTNVIEEKGAFGAWFSHAGTGDKNEFSKGEIWPQIIEKAYNQWKGEGIHNPVDCMEALTGRVTKTITPTPPIATLAPQDETPRLSFPFEDLEREFNAGNPIVITQPKPAEALALKNMFSIGTTRWIKLYDSDGVSHLFNYDEMLKKSSSIIIG